MENTIIKADEVVHCKTQEEANEVLAIAHDLGYKWYSGTSFIKDSLYRKYESETCYCITAGKYCYMSYYEKDGKTIISAEKFIERYEALKNIFEERNSTQESILQEAKRVIYNDPEKESILQEAERIVNGDRQADYSDPVENFDRIAKIASILNGKEMTSKECCIVMMAVKISSRGEQTKKR